MKLKSGILGAVACLSVLAAVPASAAVTVGNDPTVSTGQPDSCTSCTFVVNDAFGAAGLKLLSYSFYGKTTSDITPLLLTRTDSGTDAIFTIVGVGQKQTAALGLNTFAFNLLTGTNITTANSYFGFAYTNGGTVAFDYSPFSPTSGTFVGPVNYSGAIGGVFTSSFASAQSNSYDALDARTYSISAVAAVPEPATWAMMLFGFGMIGGAARYRRRETKISFA